MFVQVMAGSHDFQIGLYLEILFGLQLPEYLLFAALALTTSAGNWRVSMEVEARKVVADIAGKETEVPIVEMIEIVIFAPARPGEILGKPVTPVLP